MSGDLNKKDDAWCAIYEAKMAAKINELTSDLITTLPNFEPRKVGDKLLDYLYVLFVQHESLAIESLGGSAK